MSQLELRNIKKAYGSHLALKDVSLSIPSGAFFTLLGPSGCGKTTLLRAIAGFHQQDAGDILVDGLSIGRLGANQRHVGMVFQDYAVFPHLSVFDNVGFGLLQQKWRPRRFANVSAKSCKPCNLISMPSGCRINSAADSSNASVWRARW
jgi:iron(III) transport system ATP-binding protein